MVEEQKVSNLTKADLKKSFEAGLIDAEKFKNELFALTMQKSKKRIARKFPVPVNDEEFIALIKHTKDKQHKVAFLLGYGAGLRVSEVVKLKPEQIDLKERKIFIEQAKGGKDRIVPLPKGFKDNLINCFPLQFKNNKSGIRALQQGFKKSCNRAGLLKIKPSLHFHSLRHGFATNSVSQNIPIHHLRTLLGHSNISTTNIYLEMNPKEALKSYEELF